MNKKKQEEKEQRITRTSKSIVVNSDKNNYINRGVVKKEIYNSFNYSMLPEEYQDINLTIGVTSPNKGEGKTVTAANLAVSFALAYKRKTVLVDLNMKNPSLHNVFGTSLKPGLVESFQNGSVFLSKTKLDHLYLLPAGHYEDFSLELEDISSIRDVIYSLNKEFEIVILDMNSIFPISEFPVVFANEVDGLLIVLDAQETKYASVERIFKHINENQAMGFVFNKMNDDSY